MRMRKRNREGETLPATLQEVRRTKKGVEGEGGGEEHKNGVPAGQSEISQGNVRFCGENRKV